MKGKGFHATHANKKQETALNILMKKNKSPIEVFKALAAITKQKIPIYLKKVGNSK